MLRGPRLDAPEGLHREYEKLESGLSLSIEQEGLRQVRQSRNDGSGKDSPPRVTRRSGRQPSSAAARLAGGHGSVPYSASPRYGGPPGLRGNEDIGVALPGVRLIRESPCDGERLLVKSTGQESETGGLASV